MRVSWDASADRGWGAGEPSLPINGCRAHVGSLLSGACGRASGPVAPGRGGALRPYPDHGPARKPPRLVGVVVPHPLAPLRGGMTHGPPHQWMGPDEIGTTYAFHATRASMSRCTLTRLS